MDRLELQWFWAESLSKLFWSPVICLFIHLSVNFSHFHLPQNHWANFNQTWHKVFLGEGKFVQMKGNALFQVEILWNSKNTLMKFKNLILWNHWANINQTWRKASMGEGVLKVLQIRTIQFSKRRSCFFSLLANQHNAIIISLPKCVYWFELVSKVSDVAHWPLVSKCSMLWE